MNNKKAVLPLACALLFSAFAQAQESLLSSSSKAKLIATTSIRQQSVCLSDSGRARVNFALNVKFTNVGSYPVIFTKFGVAIAAEYTAHSEEMANSEKYEHKLLGDLFNFLRIKQEESPGDLFTILKPNETYERDMDAWALDLNYPKEYEHYFKMAHFLRIGFWMTGIVFISSDDKIIPSKESRSRWKKYGELVDGVTSQPMRFEVPQSASLKKCL